MKRLQKLLSLDSQDSAYIKKEGSIKGIMYKVITF